MISTSGSQLLLSSAVETLKAKLLPRTFLLTPNIPEALLLLSVQDSKPSSLSALVDICKKVQALGPKNVLLKGGHLPLAEDNSVAIHGQGQKVVDIFFDGKDIFQIETPWLDSKNTHGTGCSLACNSPNPTLSGGATDNKQPPLQATSPKVYLSSKHVK
jgi:hydroxymethylpyrimidine kinase/phosphomethylpyrimidine kinase